MMVFGVYLFIVLFTSQAEGKLSWSYSGPTGPSNWGKIPGASACLGKKQSPININTFETDQKDFAPFVFQGFDANGAGGAANSAGGAANGAGGAANGAGGAANGAGGAANHAGGAVNGAGGAANGAGGAANGAGGAANGAANGAGGAANGAGGAANGAGGAANGAGGAVNGAGGPANYAGGAVNGAGGALRMQNTGVTLSVTLAGGNYFINGGGLPNKYKAAEFHLHWGSDNSKGSEHTKNGNAYPAEMHIIHYNTKFRNIGEAISKPNGLAVLGFWFTLGRHNAAWDPIINNLQAVKYAYNPHIFTTTFPLDTLIPSDLSRFYRYAGSLTTPGCYETVIWTVFDNKITISSAQIAKLRQLSTFQTPPYGPGAGPELHPQLTNNFRPIQRLWFRTVYQSWPHDAYSYYGGEGTRPGWSPKFKGIFSGHPPTGNPAGGAGAGAGPGAGAGAGPAKLEDEHYLEGDTGDAQTGMQRLWYALRNGEYGEEDDFDYYEGDYGNANQNNYGVSLYDPY